MTMSFISPSRWANNWGKGLIPAIGANVRAIMPECQRYPLCPFFDAFAAIRGTFKQSKSAFFIQRHFKQKFFLFGFKFCIFLGCLLPFLVFSGNDGALSEPGPEVFAAKNAAGDADAKAVEKPGASRTSSLVLDKKSDDFKETSAVHATGFLSGMFYGFLLGIVGARVVSGILYVHLNRSHNRLTAKDQKGKP